MPRELAGRWFAPGAVAVSLVGFWLYLGLLAVVGVRPHTSLTGVYYVLLGAVLWPLAWRRRGSVVARLRASRLAQVYAAATALLFFWFTADAVVRVHTTFALRLAAQLVLWTAPTALVLLGMARDELERTIRSIVAVGTAFAVLELAMSWRGSIGGRYSPLAHLDPISAAQYAAIALVALLSLSLRTERRWAIAYFGATAVLVFGTFLPGSRGPVVGAVLASVGILVLRPALTGQRLATAALLTAAGMGAYAAAAAVGSSSHLTPGMFQSKPSHPAHISQHALPAVSSDEVRSALLRQALDRARRRLLVGNGVGTLADESAVAKRIGLNGCCTYPHNEPVEALYSLGIGGLVLYALAFAAAAMLFLRALRGVLAGRRAAIAIFALAFALYAFVQSEVSGEIAEDVWIWAAASLVLVAASAPDAA